MDNNMMVDVEEEQLSNTVYLIHQGKQDPSIIYAASTYENAQNIIRSMETISDDVDTETYIEPISIDSYIIKNLNNRKVVQKYIIIFSHNIVTSFFHGEAFEGNKNKVISADMYNNNKMYKVVLYTDEKDEDKAIELCRNLIREYKIAHIDEL